MALMTTVANRALLVAKDGLQFSGATRRAIGFWRTIADRARPCRTDQERARSIARMCGVARLATAESTIARADATIARRLEGLNAAKVDWAEFVPGTGDPNLPRAVVLKPWLGPREKGVIFFSCEEQWFKLLKYCDLAQFAARYTLVVAPSWCPPHSVVNAVFPSVYPERLFMLLSNAKDLTYIPRLSSKYVIVPLLASHWVNPDLYQPRTAAARDIDVVMAGSFARFKRHQALFRAMRKMKRRPRVLILGQERDGRTADTIRAEAEAFGVQDAVTIVANPRNESVADSLCRAKVSVVLSRRDGSCPVVAESLFAGTPVGMLAESQIGSSAHINDQTGRFLNEARLAEELEAFIDSAAAYRPRAWAEQYLSCHRSTSLMNNILQHSSHGGDQQWTADIATLTLCPDPQVLGDEAWERHLAERAEIERRFGVAIGPTARPDGAAGASASRSGAVVAEARS